VQRWGHCTFLSAAKVCFHLFHGKSGPKVLFTFKLSSQILLCPSLGMCISRIRFGYASEYDQDTHWILYPSLPKKSWFSNSGKWERQIRCLSILATHSLGYLPLQLDTIFVFCSVLNYLIITYVPFIIYVSTLLLKKWKFPLRTSKIV
jgi:hypothetical protein